MSDHALAKVISGGQTGADEAGVKVARWLRIPTGGTMPKGWRTQDGPRPEYADRYGMVEHTSTGYGPRTFVNVADADLTLRLACDFGSAGELLTAKACAKLGKPVVDVHVTIRDARRPVQSFEVDEFELEAAIAAIRDLSAKIGRPIVVNVAGNSDRTAPGMTVVAWEILTKILAPFARTPAP